ncbi:MAG TPA: tetratricopeptide repeat protein [Vicinamibacterales bacterium]|nr:tetratricopeptide repeat protein [Vicinamibacterales bacterium]
MLLISARAFVLAGALLVAGGGLANSQELPAPEAWAALDRGDGSKAAAIFRDALDRAPHNALLHYGSAHASLLLGRTEAAISSLKKAVEHNPRFVEAMVLLAQVAYGAADLDLAVRSLEKAVAIVPRDRELAAQLAQWKKEADLHQSFQVRPGVRFNVLFEGPAEKAIGDRVSAVLDSAYASIGKQLDIYPGATLEVILYSNKQFQDITRAPAWAGGGYDGRIRLPVGNALRSPRVLDRVVIHEYVHSVVRTVAPTGVPAWINEGLASYLEPGDKTWAARALKASADRIPLEDMVEGFGGFDGPTALLAYAESQVAAELLVERLKPHVGAFLQLLGNGHTVDQALSRHGVQPDTFYAEWRRRIGVREGTR